MYCCRSAVLGRATCSSLQGLMVWLRSGGARRARTMSPCGGPRNGQGAAAGAAAASTPPSKGPKRPKKKAPGSAGEGSGPADGDEDVSSPVSPAASGKVAAKGGKGSKGAKGPKGSGKRLASGDAAKGLAGPESKRVRRASPAGAKRRAKSPARRGSTQAEPEADDDDDPEGTDLDDDADTFEVGQLVEVADAAIRHAALPPPQQSGDAGWAGLVGRVSAVEELGDGRRSYTVVVPAESVDSGSGGKRKAAEARSFEKLRALLCRSVCSACRTHRLAFRKPKLFCDCCLSAIPIKSHFWEAYTDDTKAADATDCAGAQATETGDGKASTHALRVCVKCYQRIVAGDLAGDVMGYDLGLLTFRDCTACDRPEPVDDWVQCNGARPPRLRVPGRRAKTVAHRKPPRRLARGDRLRGLVPLGVRALWRRRRATGGTVVLRRMHGRGRRADASAP